MDSCRSLQIFSMNPLNKPQKMTVSVTSLCRMLRIPRPSAFPIGNQCVGLARSCRPLTADPPGRWGAAGVQGTMRGCPQPGCGAGEEAMLLLPCGRPRAREAAPGAGAPPRGRSLCSEESAAFTASLPDPPPPLLSFPFFPSLPASHSCCLGEPALVREEATFPCKAQGRGQLPLLQPTSREDGEGMAKGGGQRHPAQAEDEHACPWRRSWALWFGADVACMAPLWLGRRRETGTPPLSASPPREVLKMVKKEV